MLHYLPLIVGFICAVLVVVARLLTNYHVRKRPVEVLLRGTAIGLVPGWISAIYFVSFIGLGVSCIWSFISVAWWAGATIALLYILTEFVRSAVSPRRRPSRVQSRTGAEQGQNTAS
jgi:hypothetical protein